MIDRPSFRRPEASDPSRQLSARTLQVFGLLLILASAVFWAFTQRESALLVGAGITLSTLGWLQRAFTTAQEKLPRYDPPELEQELVKHDQLEQEGRRKP